MARAKKPIADRAQELMRSSSQPGRDYCDTLEDGREVTWTWSEGPEPLGEGTPADVAKTVHIEVEAAGMLRAVKRPLLEQLDGLERLHLVRDDPKVRAIVMLVADSHREVVAALKRAAESPELSAAHKRAVKKHVAAVQRLRAVALSALERRSRTQPDVAALARKVSPRQDADTLLAVDALLRSNPHWRDPWERPDLMADSHYAERLRRYFGTAVPLARQNVERAERRGDARLRRARRTLAQTNPRTIKEGVRTLLRLVRPTEDAALSRIELERHAALWSRLFAEAPDDQRRIMTQMKFGEMGPYEAAATLGLLRTTAVALRARAVRLERQM